MSTLRIGLSGQITLHAQAVGSNICTQWSELPLMSQDINISRVGGSQDSSQVLLWELLQHIDFPGGTGTVAEKFSLISPYVSIRPQPQRSVSAVTITTAWLYRQPNQIKLQSVVETDRGGIVQNLAALHLPPWHQLCLLIVYKSYYAWIVK